MPASCIFADKGPAAFVEGDDPREVLALCAAVNSAPFRGLVALRLARTELAQSYEVGLIQEAPVPDLTTGTRDRLARLAHVGWSLRWRADTYTESSHAFILPGLLQVVGTTLLDRAAAVFNHVVETRTRLNSTQRAINDLCFSLYGIVGDDREQMERGFRSPAAEEDQNGGVESDTAERDRDKVRPLVTCLLSWAVGVAFGRFDVQLATGERELPAEPEPFDPLPPCPPGMLIGTNGLPVDQPSSDYSVHFPRDGVLVDDEGHERDLTARTHHVFQAVFENHADSYWQDSGEIIDRRSGDLRQWFAGSFFALHIKRYSKSRRKAPIYWQLSTPSAKYSVWLYYHRFTKDTLYKVLQDFVTPKVQHEERKLEGLRTEAGTYPTGSQRREIERQESFVRELNAFREEVIRVAPLWNPNLNDGVIINFAPLWRLIPQHRSWQKECKRIWDKLVEGDYDWAHLAMHLWPDRVIPKCREDRSLAITHGLESIFWHEDENGKWLPREVDPLEVQALISERTSPAVRAAFEKLVEAPVPRTGNAVRKVAARRTASSTRTAARVLDSEGSGRRSGEQSVRPVDNALVDKVRAVIASNGAGTSKSDVIEATGITSSQWSKVIKTLVADGTVTQTGERRGARYHLAGAGA